MQRRGILTCKQLRVLALASRGLSLAQVAEALGVSRQDASVALHRARRNLEKALETLEAYYAASSPVLVEAAPGETVGEVASRLLEAADRAGVRLPLGRAEVALLLRGLLRGRLDGDRVTEETCIALGPEALPLVVDCGLASALRSPGGEGC